jgi:formylglycine-generating enzyme required for sulfatase activity
MGTKPKTLRGGSWNNNPTNVRISIRNRNEPENRNNNIGFRCLGMRALS